MSRLPQFLTAGAIVLIAAIVHRRLKQHAPSTTAGEPDNVTVRRCEECGKFNWPGAERCDHCGVDVGVSRA